MSDMDSEDEGMLEAVPAVPIPALPPPALPADNAAAFLLSNPYGKTNTVSPVL